jgi:uncharacterized Zn-binding protein involved in type VI secretion
VDAINRAFGIHRVLGVVPYNFTPVGTLPFQIVIPSPDAAIYGSTISGLQSGQNYMIVFDDIVTKIADNPSTIANGDQLKINGSPVATAGDGLFYVGNSLGHGQHYVTVTAQTNGTIVIELDIGAHTEGNPQVSFGYRVTSITPG